MAAARQDLLRDEYLTLTIMILSPASVLRRQFPEFFETLKCQFESCLEGLKTIPLGTALDNVLVFVGG